MKIITMASTMKRTYRMGSMILQEASMPLDTPASMMTRETTMPTMIQKLLAPPVAKVICRASGRLCASGAMAPKVPPMTSISVPMAVSSPVMAILV